ncbi:MAG: hypothetical protein SFW36_16235 [Leptolyngbyaceae cyanobacterium bins.59]|nr:hypothetical protein [Leptolyngbyaceae cyanobacterium bins.59]
MKTDPSNDRPSTRLLVEVVERLAAPFPAEAYDVRDIPGGGYWVYLKWQQIRDRLDEVVPNWECSYCPPVYLGQNEDYCAIGCTITILGVSRQEWGDAKVSLISNSGNDMARGTPLQRARAKAFSNAAEAWGIGRELDDQKALLQYLIDQGDRRPQVMTSARKKGVSFKNKGIGLLDLPRPDQGKPRPKETDSNSRISVAQVKELMQAKLTTRYSDQALGFLMREYNIISLDQLKQSDFESFKLAVSNPALAIAHHQNATAQAG